MHTAKVPMKEGTEIKSWSEISWITYITGMSAALAATYDP